MKARLLGFGVGAVLFAATAMAAPTGVLKEFDYSGEGSLKASYGDLTFLVDSVNVPAQQNAPRLRGFAGGKLVFSARLDATTNENARAVVKIVTLAKDGPQVVFQHYTYGAHCCTETMIATRHDDVWSVVAGDTLDGDGGYVFDDLDGDGDQELIGADDSFLYMFSSYAESVAPIRIQHLDGTRLVDVTADPRFRRTIAKRLTALESDEGDGARFDSNGFLAGWVATKVLAGDGPAAWTRMLKSYDKDSEWPLHACDDPVPVDECREERRRDIAFPEALRLHLLARGYIKDVALYPLPAAPAKASGAAR